MKLLESTRAGMPTVTTLDSAPASRSKTAEKCWSRTTGGLRVATRSMVVRRWLRERTRTASYAYLESHHSLAAAGSPRDFRPREWQPSATERAGEEPPPAAALGRATPSRPRVRPQAVMLL
jgi:hypothetical protein